MEKKWVELFQGLMNDAIPFDGTGFIMLGQFDKRSDYTKIETIAFRNVKKFSMTDDGVTFYSDGYKIFLLYEPPTYRFRFQEPFLRSDGDNIPLRFNELHNIQLSNHARLYISKEPYMSFGTFNVARPESGNFVYYFYDNGHAEKNLQDFLGQVLRDDLRVPRSLLPQVFEPFLYNLQQFYRDSSTGEE